MELLKIEDICPVVRIANHHPVTPQMLWERSIPDPQLLCVLSGAFEFTESAFSPLLLAPGDVLFIEPDRPHRFSLAAGEAGGWIAGMHFEFAPSGRWAASDYRLSAAPARLTRSSEAPYLAERFKRMAQVYESYRPYRRDLVNRIAAEIILSLAAEWQNEAQRAARPTPRMETILAYIRANLAGPLTRQSLAETFSLSPGYINQLFKLELGMPPSAVINRERLARAYQLLNHDGLAVAEAAYRVGYQDPFYFSRLFKEIYTVSPSQVAAKRQDG